MSEETRSSKKQFDSDRPEEQDAVRTTIVGGRPTGSGQRVGPIPRGVEVLVKKAAVDAEFREVLLERRAAAAGEIGLELDPTEALMLAAVPADQLRAIIQRTTVPQEHRRAFLGQAAAAMLAAVGGMVPSESAGASQQDLYLHVRGIRPSAPKFPQPGTAAGDDAKTKSLVRSILAKVIQGDPEDIQPETKLKADLGLTPNQFQAVHDALEAECEVPFSLDVLQQLETIADVVEHVDLMREVWPAVFDVLTERLPLPAGTIISAESSLTDDLKATAEHRAVIRQELAGRLRLPPTLAPRTLEQQTVGDLVMLLAAAVRRRKEIESKIQELPRPSQPRPVRGSQPDLP